MKNKIGWCDITWNPVWGCFNNCEYCYARGIAKRFWERMYRYEFKNYCGRYLERVWEKTIEGVGSHPTWVWTGDYLSGLKDFKPTFLISQFNKKFPKKPQKIFVGSMSGIYYWKKEWVEKALEKVRQYPQHIFQFLSKDSYAYHNYPFYHFPKNCWLGITITKETDLKNISHRFIYSNSNITFLSIEPILEKIKPQLINSLDINWVIVGAESGNRKGKVIPEREWIEKIVDYCKDNNIPVYLKDSLKEIYPVEIKEFPKEEK